MFTAVKGSKTQDHTAYRVVEFSYAEVSWTAYPTSGNLMWEYLPNLDSCVENVEVGKG